MHHAQWLETNASDPALRDQIAILREKAAHVRSSMAATPPAAGVPGAQ